MANSTTKLASPLSDENVIRDIHVPEIASISTTGFLQGKALHRITPTVVTTNTAGDTQRYTYSDNGTVLLVIDIVYTDGTRTTVLYYQNNTPA